MDEAREIIRLQAENQSLKTEIDGLRKEFHDYVSERQKEESKRLRTALIWAGGIILGLGSFVWYDVVWPVIQAGRIQ